MVSLLTKPVAWLLPEVINVGRFLATRVTGDNYVPASEDNATVKGSRTVWLAFFLVAAKIGEWFGFYEIPMEAYDYASYMFMYTIGAKAVR